MINLTGWAAKHNLPYEAVYELMVAMGLNDYQLITEVDTTSEAGVQSRIRLEASQKGCRLWRNNVGAGMLEDGSFIRWGLANETKAMNKKTKSSDLIGIRPVLITQEMVGQTIGQFIAREVKAGDWNFTATEREEAQLNFIQLVVSLGGDAAFANKEGTL